MGFNNSNILKEGSMQVNLSTNYNLKEPNFTAITADRVGRSLLVQRMKQVKDPVADWEELLKLIEKYKNDPNDIFITGGNGDGGIGIVVTNRKTGAQARFAESPLKINPPIDLIKEAISTAEGFNKNIRPMFGVSKFINDILDKM
jgi:FixJ family two-component response regulator